MSLQLRQCMLAVFKQFWKVIFKHSINSSMNKSANYFAKIVLDCSLWWFPCLCMFTPISIHSCQRAFYMEFPYYKEFPWHSQLSGNFYISVYVSISIHSCQRVFFTRNFKFKSNQHIWNFQALIILTVTQGWYFWQIKKILTIQAAET